MKPFDVYNIYPIEPARAEGAYLYDADGTRYLDFYGGHAVISIGHSHPHYIRRLTEQLSAIGFYSNAVRNSLQDEYARVLGSLSGCENYDLFLCNSGAEANENALKLASFHTGRKRVLAFGDAFHGRTSGAVAATDIPSYRSPFNLTDNVTFVPFNDAAAAVAELESGEYGAVIVEGIQGVGGIRVADCEFLRSLRRACDRSGTILVLDEVQSGCGRTGRYFAFQHSGIEPDIITAAKGIGNGFPMAAVLISPKIEAVKGQLGTTFGGNHLACAAGLAVAEVITEQKLMENAREVGEYIQNSLLGVEGIAQIRGRGLMIGIETREPMAELRRKLLFDHHIFTGSSGTHTIRLLPPLTATTEQADSVIRALKTLLQQ